MHYQSRRSIHTPHRDYIFVIVGSIQLAKLRHAVLQTLDPTLPLHAFPTPCGRRQTHTNEPTGHNLTTTTYSRDEVVSELTSFYEFLVSMYLSPDALRRPPPGGWPDITVERLAFLGKNESVINLLKHIPYIRQSEVNTPFHIYEGCACNDYAGDRFQKDAVPCQSKDTVYVY